MLQDAHWDVAVLRARELADIPRTVVPVGGGPHARLGLRLTADIACGCDAELVVLRVFALQLRHPRKPSYRVFSISVFKSCSLLSEPRSASVFSFSMHDFSRIKTYAASDFSLFSFSRCVLFDYFCRSLGLVLQTSLFHHL